MDSESMSLSIDSLREMGAFTGAPVEREITWKSKGQEFTATVYVRPLSYKTAVSDIRSMTGDNDPVAGRIAACICDENGKPVFTPDDITGDADPDRGPLDGNLTMALLGAIAEVTGMGETPAS
jgi:hypothetical protein